MNQFVNALPDFVPPIVFVNQRFIFTRFAISGIERVIKWCKKEYWDSLRYWSERGNFKNVKFEVEEFSTIRLMATLSVFDEIISFFKTYPFVWDSLSKPSRRFLSSAYEFKCLMNGQKSS